MRAYIHAIKVIIALIIAVSATAQTGYESFNYISPKPGSKFINPENNIALRHGEVLDINSVRADMISVTGSQRGNITGTIKLSLDQRTLIFLPDQPYGYNEKITVTLEAGLQTKSGKVLEGLSFGFTTMEMDNTEMLHEFYKREFERETKDLPVNNNSSLNNHTQSASRSLPIPTIAEFNNPAEGYIFCTPRPWQNAPYDPHMMILDNYGTPVFYRQWPRRSNDFKTIVGNRLTFCDFDRNNTAINKYIILDSHFNQIDTLVMGNGYVVDQHDVIVQENGNYFLMAYDPQLVGMDTVVEGGDPNATVTGFVVQELDADDNVIFQWRSWDHFEITDANHTDFTAAQVDYVHGNAFEIDYDNNLMMSMRDMEEITKIDRNSGEIIWRLGVHAKNNMFDFGSDTIGWSWQHDIRRISNGNITIYDNGNHHTPSFSQAVEYNIDEENFTATLVWNYIHDPVVFARATGAHRRLDNNNSFICWGLTWPINYSEVSYGGDLAWELHWPMNVWDYRAFKLNWETDMFETSVDTIDYGTYDDYVAWPRIFTVTNNADHDIEITSTHNHWDSYYVTNSLPLTIPAGETVQMTVSLNPTMEGEIHDVLTLNYDSYFSDTLAQRVSKQIVLLAYVEDDTPPEAEITPEDGTAMVSQSAVPMITFTEPVVKADGSILPSAHLAEIITFKEDNASGEDVAYYAHLNPMKTEITIHPASGLKPLQTYYLSLAGGTVGDQAGHIINEDVESTFTTADEQAPIATVTPENEATDVSTLTTIVYEFDEPVYHSEGGTELTEDDLMVILTLKETDETGENVGFSASIDESNSIITIVPDSLKTLQQYYAELLGGTVEDESGNELEESISTTFTTADDTGIDDKTEERFVTLFPNPNNGNLSLEFVKEGKKDISVINMEGKVVQAENDVQDALYHINISDEKNGIYFIRVEYEDGNTIYLKTIKL